MRIVEKSADNKINFKALSEGDCFKFLGCTCMKMIKIEDSDGCIFNGVNLSDGELLYLKENDKVIPLNAQIVVESMQ